ncbi:immunoglobulin kappa light chain-like [Betta splendens]|uniref:immunoglobulin kappa light chain-like n=1 Tax=Betta splendens TaxID=158456 RepID=UPI0010F44241|nr:immunoglobulin kappa light chain-like [Betta splendens]
MLFLPAAALCCLCSALVAMAAQLHQEDLTLTRRSGGSISFSCRDTHQCGSYIYWYQKKQGGTFRVILGINKNNGNIAKGYNHPQENDFSSVNKGKDWELELKQVKVDHAASYYCTCWKSGYWYYIFGSGTELVVTDEPVLKPVVSVYPAASRGLEASGSLLCVASHMFPPRVRFSWKVQKEDGSWAKPSRPEEEQLELEESGRSASILLHGPQSSTAKYRCEVQHEGGAAEARTAQEVPAPAASCPPEREAAAPAALQPTDELPLDRDRDRDREQNPLEQQRVKLLCVCSTVLIVKSLVYCCGLSVLRILRTEPHLF